MLGALEVFFADATPVDSVLTQLTRIAFLCRRGLVHRPRTTTAGR